MVLSLKSTTSKWCCNQPNGAKPSAKGLARTLCIGTFQLIQVGNLSKVRCHGESGIPELLYPHTKFPSEYCTPIHDSLVNPVRGTIL